jgi:hypothetical protein
MRRPAVAILLAACALAVAALAAGAATDERALAFNLGVQPEGPVAALEPGRRACQRGIGVPARFDAVELLLGTYARPGPALAVTVHRPGGQAIGAGKLPAGARDNQPASVRVTPAVSAGEPVDVCVRNDGDRRVALYGGGAAWSPSVAFAGGREVRGDLRMRFFRSEPRSVLSLVPDMFERAALFRPDPIGAWSFWALLAGVAVGVPLLLAGALRAALSTDPREDRSPP